MAIDALAGGLVVFEREGLSLVRRVQIGWTPVLLAKPLTYVDRCGEAVKLLLRAHAGDPARTVILYDDALLPFGFVRVRSRGIDGNHDGMKSILRELWVREIPRIRIGIGLSPTTVVSLKVLREDFTDPERDRLPGIFQGVAAALAVMVEGKMDKAMSLFNRRDIPLDKLPMLAPEAPAGP